MVFLTRAAPSQAMLMCRPAAHRCLSTSQKISHMDANFYPVYVHHLSKVVLEHLQNSQSQWLIDQGLDRGLQVKNNGTFVLHFPETEDQVECGRIWTSYDAAKKEHWLSVYRQRLVGRFLIKGNLEGRGVDAVNEEVRTTVDKMIRTVSDMERTST